jgi:hypothetical protein
MAQQQNPARKRVRAIVPKMIELSEQVIYGDIWERPQLSKRDRSLIVVGDALSSLPIDRNSSRVISAGHWTTASRRMRSPRLSLI